MVFKHLEKAKTKIEYLWLKGDDFTLKEVMLAKKNNKMLTLDIDFTDECNLYCEYCDRTPDRFSRKHTFKKISTEKRLEVIREAKELGARVVEFPGAGEPFLDEGFWEVIQYVNSLGLTSVIFTNGCYLDEQSIDRLHNLNSSIILKYNSRNKDVQDKIVRLKGYGEKLEKSLQLLLEKGFTKTLPTRLGIDMVVTPEYYSEQDYESIFRWCRQNNIHIYISSLIPEGLSDKSSKVMERNKAFNLMKRFYEIDSKEFGLEYDSLLPFGGGYRCRKVDTGLFVNLYGEVYDCNGLGRILGSIWINSLEEIWNSNYARHVRKNQKDGYCVVRERFWRNTDTKGMERKLEDYRAWRAKNGADHIVDEGLKYIGVE